MPREQLQLPLICQHLTTRFFCCLLIDFVFFGKNISNIISSVSFLLQYLRKYFPLPEYSPHIRPCDYGLRFYGFFFHIRSDLGRHNNRKKHLHFRPALRHDHISPIKHRPHKIRQDDHQKHHKIPEVHIFFHKNTIIGLFSNICSFAKNYYLRYTCVAIAQVFTDIL